MAIKKTTIVGQSFPRVESNAKVTGAAQYVDDMQFGANLLYGRLKRSTMPHAWIKRIDVSKAKALPGVRVVVTGQDYPGLTGLYQMCIRDSPHTARRPSPWRCSPHGGRIGRRWLFF